MNTNSIIGMLVNLCLAGVIVAICYVANVPEYVLMVHENYAIFIAKLGFVLACLAFLELPFGYFSIHDSIMTFWLAAVLLITGLVTAQFGLIAVLIPVGFVIIATTSLACTYQNKLLGLLIGAMLMLTGIAWRELTPPPGEICNQVSSEKLYQDETTSKWSIVCPRTLHGASLSSKVTSFTGTLSEAREYAERWRNQLVNSSADFRDTSYGPVEINFAGVPSLVAAKKGDSRWVGAPISAYDED